MKLIRLELHKCKRLSLGEIEKFVIEPTTPIQFIIGTNGSGKTSVIQEMSPFPPDKNDFEEGGYKKAIFSLEGKVIEVLSIYSGGPGEHSFLVDGVEKNDGGTLRVQQELCRQYFRYTEEIHQLITNVSADAGLTSMGLTERKKWFTLLADSNYDYAVSVFKKTQEKYNESKAALKRSKERLAVEAAKILSIEEMDKLRSECEELYRKVQMLIEIKEPLMTPAEDLVHQANQGAMGLKKLAEQVKELTLSLNPELPKDLKKCQSQKTELTAHLEFTEKKADQTAKEYEQFKERYDASKKTQMQNAAQLAQLIENGQKEIEQLLTSLVVADANVSHPEQGIATVEYLIGFAAEHRSELSMYKDKDYSRQKLLSLINQLGSLVGEITQVSNLLSKTEQVIEHQRNHQRESDVQCPQCRHVFQPNFSEKVLQDALRKEHELKERLEKLQKLQSEIKREQELCEYVLRKVNQFHEALFANEHLKDLGKRFSDEQILKNKPNDIIPLLTHYKSDLQKLVRIQEITKELEADRKIQREVLKYQEQTLSVNLDAENDRWLDHLHRLDMDKAGLFKSIVNLDKHIAKLQSLQTLSERLDKGVDYTDQKLLDANESIRRQVIDEMLKDFQRQLAEKENVLQSASRQASVVEHIQGEINALQQESEEWKVLVQELSPTKGLIAEGIYGFMKTMIEQMNKTLEQLFSYPLEVLPCTAEGEDVSLTYKFPLKVDGDTRSDIAKGSSGMREVINLSFVIAAMKALGLGQYMLFLDEFGSKLDPVHKQAANMMLSSMLELERFEQVYMISHDVSQYNAFGKSQICVLHAGNVQLPPGCSYNTHVTIE